ncbi:hypothetical protein HNQ77_002405 [Silvibacterium bohemicum]|uniref:Uncharacterized protein n=1 Tax=Silvibacterium bohemicum TaxID=1577686 RepID=A0A841JSS3_9BACT|nr:hypothetical protein [Silvibacterium bohemicum]
MTFAETGKRFGVLRIYDDPMDGVLYLYVSLAPSILIDHGTSAYVEQWVAASSETLHH